MAFAPALLGALPTILSVVGTVAAIGGTLMTASASANADRYQAQVAQKDSQIQALNADRAEYDAQIKQQDQDNVTAATEGAVEANQGASGLSIGGGSQILTRKSVAMLGRQDALRIRAAGDANAYNFLTQSASSQKAADFANASAGNSLLTGFISAGAQAIGGYKDYLKVSSPTPINYANVAVPSATTFGG